MTLVSVVIPVLNGATTIGATLTALRAQDRAPAHELIVVDNGSTDGTQAMVAAVPGVTLLHEPKRGPAAARNRGLHHARGEVIVYLDADTLPSRGWLRALVALFADPAVTLAVGRTECYRPQTPVERYIAGCGLYESRRAIGLDPFPFAASLNMAVRRNAALDAGGWCEELLTGEDVDFSQRVLARVPGPIAYAERALLFHRVRSTDAELRALARSYGRGAAQLYRRYPERARWDLHKSVVVLRTMIARAVTSLGSSAGRRLRLVPEERSSFQYYHLFWFWNYSVGFFGEFLRRTA